jgi:hypothetical protein
VHNEDELISTVSSMDSNEQQQLNLLKLASLSQELYEKTEKRITHALTIQGEIDQQHTAMEVAIHNLFIHVESYSDRYEMLLSKFKSLGQNITEYAKEIDIQQLKELQLPRSLQQAFGCTHLIDLISRSRDNVEAFVSNLSDFVNGNNNVFTTRSMAMDEIQSEKDSIYLINETYKKYVFHYLNNLSLT